MKDHFVRRRLGEEKPVYLHPSLRQTLADTYGVMLYQEDILRVAHAAAGFTLEEGDALRRTIKENPDPVRLGALHRRFVEGAVRNGGDPDQAEELWKLLNNFAAYSYCKAHATTYGYISYQAAYLKARYPAEFLAAVLANQAGFYETREYVEEARRLGVKILPPDVNRSEMNFHPAAARPEGIRVGLMRVRELSARSIESILAAREQLPFASLADFVERASVCQSEAENLALCGALDCFGRLGGQGGTRPELLWKAQLLFRQSKALGERASSATAQRSELFSRLIKETARSGRVHKLLDLVPPLPDYTLAEKLSLEQELLGLTVTDHPLAAYESQLREVEHIPCHRLHLHVGKRVTVIGWLVTMRRAVTERGEYMKFVTLEDRQGLVEVVLFPDVYQKYGRLIGGYGPYIIEGKVKSHHGSLALTAESIEFLSGDSLGPRPRRAPAHQHTHAPSQTQHP
jgi:DNA polymerase III alpha subunit